MAEHGPFAQLVTEASRRLTVLCFVNPLCQPPFQPRNRTLGFSVSTAENDFAEIAVAVVPPCSPLLCKIAFFYFGHVTLHSRVVANTSMLPFVVSVRPLTGLVTKCPGHGCGDTC